MIMIEREVNVATNKYYTGVRTLNVIIISAEKIHRLICFRYLLSNLFMNFQFKLIFIKQEVSSEGRGYFNFVLFNLTSYGNLMSPLKKTCRQ